ncbi:PA14 domain-containing protein [Flavihumibacter sp. UBA7668]|uniref:PA14 domain-containing protein n=1 Tax=Flavihumibacter sp. UBA7668 TaxID=1946542 RepID=UPI0025C190CD|nr:PA14 domain-containing protein [Flavihumibacter sp. UBA7668]
MFQLFSRYQKLTAYLFLIIFYSELFLIPAVARANYYSRDRYYPLPAVRYEEIPTDTNYLRDNIHVSIPDSNRNLLGTDQQNNTFGGGPTQPEMQSFSSVNGNNMVDLFTGDFSYSIPLLDVGGYPLTLGYKGGVSMEQEASWVGLGWNVNPGTITRNMRGLPDDFTGDADSIRKVTKINENKTVGVTLGADLELAGMQQGNFGAGIGFSLGLFKNTYKGWGMESGLNASIRVGSASKGGLSGGLSFANNSQEGLTVSPSFSVKVASGENEDKAGYGASFSISSPYNARSGIKVLQLSAGMSQYKKKNGSDNYASISSTHSHGISFASPTFVPTINLPYTSENISFTAKVGTEFKVIHPSFFISGYQSRQYIDAEDTMRRIPAFGYLNYHQANDNTSALLDFNREKEIPYREKPAVPHIAMPFYTPDVFSISGEGTGGMFRAYRGDIGWVRDHFMRTKDKSDRFSVDVGFGDLAHAGVDLNINRAITQTGAWENENAAKKALNFRRDSLDFQASYFKNPGEKSIIDKEFYNAVGGDDLVTIGLFQPGPSSSLIQTTNKLNRYTNRQLTSTQPLVASDLMRKERDKRTQVISYLTAGEAEEAGLHKMIESYVPDSFNIAACYTDLFPTEPTVGIGLTGNVYANKTLEGVSNTHYRDIWDNKWKDVTPFYSPVNPAIKINDNFSIRWIGRLRAPQTGKYVIKTRTDDGIRMWINDSLRINDWKNHAATDNYTTVYLTEGKFYDIRIEYFEYRSVSLISFKWNKPGDAVNAFVPIPKEVFFDLEQKVLHYPNVVKEKRVNPYRKSSHISEINVLNKDGRRYVYGIPVYNLKQTETSFSIQKSWGNAETGMSYYNADAASVRNSIGRDAYFSKEEVPAYAHSFLLTGLLSPDYVDLTGDGITDDDLGDAIKFNYSRIAGLQQPFQWRAPSAIDSVTYNEGLKSDSRDDKGSMIYGDKELWYMHSVVSKTMIATFHLEDRTDIRSVDPTGRTTLGKAKRLKEIRLYSKAEFLNQPSKAVPIKTVHFEYSYELCPGINQGSAGGKLTLKEVYFTYKGNTKGKRNRYKFSYNGINPGFHPKSMDRWGEYKNPATNPGSNGSTIIPNSEYPYTIQDSLIAAQNAGAWALDSISLPSGGAMKIQYEADEYAYVQHKRAMRMFQIAGFARSANASPTDKLYSALGDHLYVFVDYTGAGNNSKEIYNNFLESINKLFFRVAVKVPSDQFGSGFEYINCYADLSDGNYYGLVNANRFWVKLKGISKEGNSDGHFSPLVKAATQFLRLNLPSKAFIGSENDGNLGIKEAVNMLASQGENIKEALLGYELNIRSRYQLSEVELNRSYVRLLNPTYRKFGGGHRVKSIKIYDNWDKLTQQRPMVYGQVYEYNKIDTIKGKLVNRSTGVASFEPGIGGEENPFRMPIEYIEKTGILGPVTLGYTETPLGESLFPAPTIGYGRVRVRSLHQKNVKSANGLTETEFYTAYDYPVYTEHSLLDNDTKKRYRPSINNFLRINAKHFIGLSQGFKIELNDMHGKIKSQAAYAESDLVNPVTYTKYIYRTVKGGGAQKRLSNSVMAVHPNGKIDTSALIGKEVEIMVDMREQLSVTNGTNVNLNVDGFNIPPPPFIFAIPSVIGMPQREENKYRSVAVTKVVQRYGILDSVIQSDKGSIVSTRDLLYDAETGDVLLTRTNNSFRDPVYTFSYPTHWAYEGMGLAYKNIDIILRGLEIRNGKIIGGLTGAAGDWLFPGDEVLVNGSEKTGTISVCEDQPATFGEYRRLWVVDTAIVNGGVSQIYLMDANGLPYTGYNATIKVIRSGRRNLLGSVGSLLMKENPVVFNSSTNEVELQFTNDKKMIQASANQFNQVWHVNDVMKSEILEVPCTTPGADSAKTESYRNSICNCAVPFFSYLTNSNRLFTTLEQNITVDSLARAGGINISNCPLLADNAQKLFYTLTPNPFTPEYKAMIGDCAISIRVTGTIGGLPQAKVNPVKPFEGDYLAKNEANFKGPMIDESSFKTDKVVFAEQVYNFTKLKNPYCNSNGRIQFNMADTISAGNDTCKSYSFRTYYPGVGIHYFGYSYFDCNTDEYIPVYEMIESGNAGWRDFSFGIPCTKEIFSTSNIELTDTIICTVTPSDSIIQYKVELFIDSCTSCESITSMSCSSAVINTSVNPYISGLLGNWRSEKAYVYYSDRVESNPAVETNIRQDGVIADFDSFWKFNNEKLVVSADTNRWVWNIVATKYNNRGLELENLDPLGRYNAGLYGYKQTLPIAVINNSRYQESMFDGFEDYGFSTQNCDTACVVPRHIDFSSYKTYLDTMYAHSGRFSLKLGAANNSAAITVPVVASGETSSPAFTVSTLQHACTTTGSVLDKIQADSSALLPSYKPLAGQKMVISAWVKESVPCSNGTYTNNQISVVDNGGNSYTLQPSGSIIESWQRYEAVVDIHEGATLLTIQLAALNSSTVYFDDVRMHPYHANMKSFVYDAKDLRLMAELDENNYATFYEYDDEGTLVRLKKETIRGIQTIRETRSALQKN